MTSNLAPSRSITDIADRAMLVRVSIGKFSGQVTDKQITADVAKQHNAEESMGKYEKSIIAKEFKAKLTKLYGSIRNEFYRRTLPWADGGERILTSTGYSSFAAWVRTVEGEWNTAVEEFLTQWDAMVADARVKLNGMFNAADYPTRTQLEKKFYFRFTVRPVPLADDFRVALGADEVSAIRQSIESDLQETVSTAMREVWEKMHDVVSNMAKRLRAYNPEKPGESPFRDSLVANIAELLEILPSLNLTNDPNVATFTAEMRELIRFTPQQLRDNMWSREDTAARAESILSQMSQFVA